MSDTDISVRAREGGPTWLAQIQVALAAVMGLAAIAWCTDLFRPLGLLIFPEQFALGMVGATLCIAYLRFPARSDARLDGVPWYDGICSALGLVAGLYLAVVYPSLTLRLLDNPIDALIPSMIILLLTLEGLRRTVGWPLVIVVLAALAYGLFGHLLPGAFESREVDPARMAIYLNLDTSALVGPAM